VDADGKEREEILDLGDYMESSSFVHEACLTMFLTLLKNPGSQVLLEEHCMEDFMTISSISPPLKGKGYM
jgi:hypothetical protein